MLLYIYVVRTWPCSYLCYPIIPIKKDLTLHFNPVNNRHHYVSLFLSHTHFVIMCNLSSDNLSKTTALPISSHLTRISNNTVRKSNRNARVAKLQMTRTYAKVYNFHLQLRMNSINSYLADLHLTTPVKHKRDYTSDYASNETTPEKPIKQSKAQQSLHQPNGGTESKTNLIVNYLPQVCISGLYMITSKFIKGMKTELLRELFATMGDIEHVKLCKNRESRVSLGFGFVKVS